MAELSREQFVEKVIECVRAKFPLVKVARGEEPFSLKINGHTAQLENLYRLTSLKPDELQRNAELWIVEMVRAAEGRPNDAGDFDIIRSRVFPMIIVPGKGDTTGRERGLVTQPLIEGLSIAYALDEGRTISYIPEAHFKEWDVPIDELHKAAIDNLVAKSEAISAHAAQDEDGRINLILFQTMDGYDASRILLPTLHERLREHLGSPFAAAIPNRDILLCFRDDPETIDRLKEQVEEDFRQMPHQVTDRLVLVTADGLAPHG